MGTLRRPRPCRSRRFGIAAVAIAAALSGITHARAEHKHAEIDTEHIFGFVEGADIGHKGEREAVSDTSARFGQAGGSYTNVGSAIEIKHTLRDSFRVSAAATFAYYGISGVNGLDDRRQATLQNISFAARYRLLDRERAPFGMTVGIAPHWGFADDTSGAPASTRGAEFLLALDRELSKGRVFGALNLIYSPEHVRIRATGETTNESTLGLGAAMAVQIREGMFAGAETRYLRRYEGLALSSFSGQALYLGPTLYSTLGRNGWFSTTWNIQAWGAPAASAGPLDLANFERHQVKLRFGTSF